MLSCEHHQPHKAILTGATIWCFCELHSSLKLEFEVLFLKSECEPSAKPRESCLLPHHHYLQSIATVAVGDVIPDGTLAHLNDDADIACLSIVPEHKFDDVTNVI
ncbi:hypothetical protein TSUD_241820 [Trifolium subterraneum]|uniref:Uncharacterized protein n=1 Tax=Trifolium subterraneum TaxID=3900 RepID=A0A2Z6PGC5_TRISU|nr:hypothetical protein TSUD_241820 [Trifolium subterraneum]